MHLCNMHVQTPHSFSVYSSVDDLVRSAADQTIAVLGINDGLSVDGFKEFDSSCRSRHIYPLYNIALPIRCSFEHHHTVRHHQSAEEHLCRLVGTALRFPPLLNSDSRNLLASLWKASQDNIWKLIDIINTVLIQHEMSRMLDYGTIRSTYAKSSVYPQHVVLALYDFLLARDTESDASEPLLRVLFGQIGFNSDPAERQSVCVAILRNLLEQAPYSSVFISGEPVIHLLQAKQVILQAGGIPCFHCSFNDTDEWMKESEGPELLSRLLSSKGIHAVEFNPGETTIDLLQTFMRYLYHHDFCVCIGTGSTGWPDSPLVPVTADGKKLDDDLLAMGYEGACVLAAHQEMHYRNRRGFLDESGKRLIPPDQMKQFVTLGDEVIRTVTGR
ncbi:MAG: hypothetical protein JW863_13880 [Chitinispirillaceae bacterium]|nr:hypothetical protein [Chitinispirillaceae bacterium]